MIVVRPDSASVGFRPLLALLLLLCGLLPGTAAAQRAPSIGQHLYLPIYAFISHGDLDKSGIARQFPVSARYYSTEGKFLRNFVASPRILKPVETLEFLVERRDLVGGSGANFVIQWESGVPVSPPLVQALHADVQTNRAIVFANDAVVIAR